MNLYLKIISQKGEETRESLIELSVEGSAAVFDATAEMIRKKAADDFAKYNEGWTVISSEYVAPNEPIKTTPFVRNEDNDGWNLYFEAVTPIKTDDGMDFESVAVIEYSVGKLPSFISPMEKVGMEYDLAHKILEEEALKKIYAIREISQVEFKQKRATYKQAS